MKKVFLLCLLLTGLCCTAAELKVYCSTYPVWLLTREITNGVKGVSAELVIPAGTGCPHEYVLTPADMRRLGAKNCIVVRNGLGLDDFILPPLAKMNPNAKIITACRKEYALKTSGHDHHEHHHKHQHEGRHEEKETACEHDRNPHFFASPDTAILMVSEITDGLVKQDPANEKKYLANSAKFKKQLQILVDRMEKMKKKLSGKAVGIQHDIFAYFCRGLGLKAKAEIMGDGAVPSAAEMKHLVHEIRENQIKVIFTEPQYPAKTAETLARECNIKVCELDPLANGPANPGTNYYLNVMKENLNRIERNLLK